MKNINTILKDFSGPIQASIDSFMVELSAYYMQPSTNNSQAQNLINFGLIPVNNATN